MPGRSKRSESRSARLWMLGLLLVCVLLLAAYLLRRRSGEVHFSRDVRPILNQNCMPCHGGVRQKNGVSFLFREEALGTGKSGKRTIVPGKPEESELIARVTSSDPDTRMPYHAPPLSPQQIDLLRRWIKQGAKWRTIGRSLLPNRRLCPRSNMAIGPASHSIDLFLPDSKKKVCRQRLRPTSPLCCAGSPSTSPAFRPSRRRSGRS